MNTISLVEEGGAAKISEFNFMHRENDSIGMTIMPGTEEAKRNKEALWLSMGFGFVCVYCFLSYKFARWGEARERALRQV